MSGFPIRADIYEIGNRRYRRNPYRPQGTRQPDSTDFGDTPDLYGDEPDANCYYNPPENFQRTNERDDISNGNDNQNNSKKKSEKPLKNKSSAAEKVAYKTDDERIMVLENKWTTEMYVPHVFLGKLIGVKGRTRSDIEKSTNCRLKIPRVPNEPLVITSFSGLESVQICIDRVEMMLLDFRHSSRFSHFAAFPLHHSSDLQTSFKRFKEGVLASPNIPEKTKNPNLFMKANRLHCTISMLRLLDDKDEDKAKSIVEDAIKHFNFTEGIEVHVQGLSIFNDDPSDVFVVYANVKSEKFQQMADYIDKKLREAVLAFRDTMSFSDSVTIHMTLLNAKYAGRAEGSQNHTPFDATTLLQEFGSFDFGRVLADKISINILSNISDGPYQMLHEFPICKA